MQPINPAALTAQQLGTAEGAGEVDRSLRELVEATGGDVQTFTTTGGLDVVPHGLGVVPQSFQVIRAMGDVRVWEAGRDWTTQCIFLQSSVSNVKVTVRINK